MNSKNQTTNEPQAGTRNAAGDLIAGQPPAPSTPAPVSELVEPGKSKQVQKTAKQAQGTVPASRQGQRNDAQVSAPKSGGPRVADPTAAPVDLQGEFPSHPPDLADNNDGGPAWPKSGVRATPTDMTTLDDDIAIDQIGREIYANVLYRWRRDERASSKPRQAVIDAIEARLLHVQGPPIPQD